jgi:hypothetical protein
MRVFKKIKIAALLLAVATVLAACAKPPAESAYPERDQLIAEVGYVYTLPAWLAGAEALGVKNAAGQTLDIVRGGVLLPKIGDYTVSYTQDKKTVTVPLKAVDTERPMFYALWDTFDLFNNLPVNVAIGEQVYLDDIFRPYDNSGDPVTVAYNVYYKGGVKVALEEDNSFTAQKGYYDVEARAIDQSGNAVLMKQKLSVVVTVEALKSQYDFVLLGTDGNGQKQVPLPADLNVTVGSTYLFTVDFYVGMLTGDDIGGNGIGNGRWFAVDKNLSTVGFGQHFILSTPSVLPDATPFYQAPAFGTPTRFTVEADVLADKKIPIRFYNFQVSEFLAFNIVDFELVV